MLLTRLDDLREKDRHLLGEITGVRSEMTTLADAVRAFAALLDPAKTTASALDSGSPPSAPQTCPPSSL